MTESLESAAEWLTSPHVTDTLERFKAEDAQFMKPIENALAQLVREHLDTLSPEHVATALLAAGVVTLKHAAKADQACAQAFVAEVINNIYSSGNGERIMNQTKTFTLDTENAKSLYACFEHGEPVAADILARYTGLDIRDLKAAGIVRTVGRWDQQLYKGTNFPKPS